MIENTENITKEQAIKAMQQGRRVSHHFFAKGEWMAMVGNEILLEDGVKCSQQEFWQWRKGAEWEDGYCILPE